ncbi:MAG: polyketide cyclase [Candidatus Fluviicola riflensis]|nr:MAG: polyketide cyclase [Candidatus Fluviicola riflensis]OGS76606.1 MAG: polyketide cyclase [Candidatus Fluviicola riflensis]OGS83039.1 MAG: polyketide cyclase [Fluviicola sp. RIFCSPHIGHO2_01_FULL_43_53]OGS88337.1 MAG: polyketide cyclase [Fluviicola sp. RIFCSPHIGHO2_12_FULL_43_24]
MAKEINTSITINATPEKVWRILTDFGNYGIWNPFITTISGAAEVGQKLKVTLKPENGKGMTLKPKVLVFEPEKEFRWVGHLGIPGLFDGEHRFQLIDNGDGTTTFIHSEHFRGILIPFFSKMLDVDTKNGFIAMNEQLKIRAELKET